MLDFVLHPTSRATSGIAINDLSLVKVKAWACKQEDPIDVDRLPEASQVRVLYPTPMFTTVVIRIFVVLVRRKTSIVNAETCANGTSCGTGAMSAVDRAKVFRVPAVHRRTSVFFQDASRAQEAHLSFATPVPYRWSRKHTKYTKYGTAVQTCGMIFDLRQLLYWPPWPLICALSEAASGKNVCHRPARRKIGTMEVCV